VGALGTGFQPDEIKLMRSVLDEAAIILPEAERTSATKAKLASPWRRSVFLRPAWSRLFYKTAMNVTLVRSYVTFRRSRIRDRPPGTRGADGISNRWRFRMNPQERLTSLGTRIRKYDIGEDELLRELGKLQPAFDGVEGEATYKEKVDAAVEWGKIYLNPLKSEKYSGGREQVRGFLLQDLALAAKIAGDIM
jgi:hypothetical protein